jgi:MprA protease rhombosortase-interaction domain-containing protein
MRHLLLSSVILAVLCTPASQAALVIYYPLDETSGNVAFDAALADGAQDATSSSVADWQGVAGIIGGAIQLSPTGQPDVNEALIYNTANTGTSILTATPFTITLWFNTTNTIAFNRAAVFLGNSTQGSMYYAVGLNATNQANQIARNTTAVAITHTPTVNDGQWHQLTAVYSATNSRTFYVDGRLAGTNTVDVPHPILNRFGVGALTRAAQTDAFGGLLDEIGLFDTAFTPARAALLNAFPRYDAVRLDDPDFDTALSIFNTQSGSVTTGEWEWSFAASLPGIAGDTGLIEGNPYVTLDDLGNGLFANAIPEPATGALLLLAGLAGCSRRRRG